MTWYASRRWTPDPCRAGAGGVGLAWIRRPHHQFAITCICRGRADRSMLLYTCDCDNARIPSPRESSPLPLPWQPGVRTPRLGVAPGDEFIQRRYWSSVTGIGLSRSHRARAARGTARPRLYPRSGFPAPDYGRTSVLRFRRGRGWTERRLVNRSLCMAVLSCSVRTVQFWRQPGALLCHMSGCLHCAEWPIVFINAVTCCVWDFTPPALRRLSNAVLMLAHRLRRWPSINTTLHQSLVLAGDIPIRPSHSFRVLYCCCCCCCCCCFCC